MVRSAFPNPLDTKLLKRQKNNQQLLQIAIVLSDNYVTAIHFTDISFKYDENQKQTIVAKKESYLLHCLCVTNY